MSNCVLSSGSWTPTSRVAATLLAPASIAVETTGLPFAATVAADAAMGRVVAAGLGQEKDTPRTHNYTARPGSPPRGRLR